MEYRLERLEITRETVLEIAEANDPGGSEPLPSAYRRILALLEDDDHDYGSRTSAKPWKPARRTATSKAPGPSSNAS